MKKITLFLACSLLIACGDDDDRTDDPPGDAAMRDMNDAVDMSDGTDMLTPVDMTPPVDMPATELGALCPAGACNVVTSSGCDTAGEACYFAGTSENPAPAPFCATAGTLGDGAACDSATGCQEGFVCIGDPGACRRICCGGSDDDCLPETTGQLCQINIVDESGTPTGVGACRLPDDCDPIAQTGCTAPDACYPSGEGAFSCTPAGVGTQGVNCDEAQCAPGFLCIMARDGEPNPTCAELCSTDTEVCDSPGTTCGGLTGYEEAGIGVCTPPAT